MGCGIDGVNRLARDHEQSIALGAAEGDIGADFGQANAADQFAFWVPHRDAAVTHRASGVAGAPEIAEHIGTKAVWTTLHAIDHAIDEQFLVRELVV